MPPSLRAVAVAVLMCSCSSEKSGAISVSDVKAAWSLRERKVLSYQIRGSVFEAGNTIRFALAFRAPHRMRLTLPEKTITFDGTVLAERVDAQKTLTRFLLDGSTEAGTLAVNQLFRPFVPEGFRAPLLLRTGVTATRSQHPLAPQAVALRVTTKDDADAPLTVTYTLRWPSLDFLQKEIQGAQGSVQLTVTGEQCDPSLSMCFPTSMTQASPAGVSTLFALEHIAINAPLPADVFALETPPDFLQRTHAMSELSAAKR